MENKRPTSYGLMLLSIQMIVDEFADQQLRFEYCSEEDTPKFSGFMIYNDDIELRKDMLYILTEESNASFPRNRYSYITTENISGSAPHIRNIKCSFPVLMNHIIHVFKIYHDFELQLNQILTGGGSLTDLCHCGSDFFKNPLYIHDDMFTVIALSTRVEGMLKFEYNEHNGRTYIPLWLINDFKFDREYQKTMELRHSALWDNDHYPYNIRSLFVNLWNNNEYLGRLMVNELRTPLTLGQYQSIEIFARYAVMLMQRDGLSQNHVYQDFEDTFIDLLTGVPADPRDLRTMLSILDWHETDQFLCLKLRDQNTRASIHPDTALSNELATVLNSFTCFHYQKSLCIVLNLTLFKGDSSEIRGLLAPYIRDSLMYGGISNPINGISEISQAFHQTDVALEYISQHDNSQWLLPFSSCALSYIRTCATKEFTANALINPAVLKLAQFDKENATDYFLTLKTYLYNERNIQKTSDALIIHRTTLTYRLKKIDDLLHLNLDDPHTRQYIIFSFYILEDSEN